MGSVPTLVPGVRPFAAGLAVFLLVSGTQSAPSQVCDGPLNLFSPSPLTVRFENEVVPGNRLQWPGVDRSRGTCIRLDISAGFESRLGPRWEGIYSNIFDRSILFDVNREGLVADRTRDEVILAVNNTHPNPAAGNLTGRINLSGRGGMFRLDLDDVGEAEQVNDGIPAHLERTDVISISQHTQSGLIYAGIDRLPVVLSDDGGASWREPTVNVTSPFRGTIRNLLVSPNDPQLLFASPDKLGLWKSSDGGVSWQRDPVVDALASGLQAIDVGFAKYLRVVPRGGNPADPNDRVNRLYIHVVNAGLFFSDDDGLSFGRVSGLRRPSLNVNPNTGVTTLNCGVTDSLRLREFPVRDIVVSPTQPEHVYVGVEKWGVHRGDTAGGHSIWEQRNLGIVACQGNSDRLLGEQRNAERIVALPSPDGTEDILIALTDQPAPPAGAEGDERSNTNLFLSQDSGRTWSFIPLRAVLDPVQGEVTLRVTSLIQDPRTSRPRGVVAGTATAGVWTLNIESQDGVWIKAEQQPVNQRIRSLASLAGGRLLVGTSGAGVYRTGMGIDLDRVLALGAGATLPPRVGLTVAFDGTGEVLSGDRFALVGQTFQAYAVWRGRELDPVTGEPDWQLIALYDLTNPEFCSPNACDESDLVRITGCFADKRANCFVPPAAGQDGGQWEYFDREVFNGFTYYYAVSTLDYGNTANVSPTNFNGDFTFSPRSAAESDPAALPYVGLNDGANFNQLRFQVNVEVARDLSSVFVVPNPLVRQAGWDVGGDSSVRFVNVTETARVQIFTMSGDLVNVVDNVVFDGSERGNIEWNTRNAEGALVASGVYIYRVTDDDGNESVDHFAIIR